MSGSHRSTSPARSDEERSGDESADTPVVNARHVSGERTVFTETDNGDGWIATDLSVSLREYR